MNLQRIVVLVLASVGMAATFLPWAGPIRGTHGDGWITLGLFAPGLLFALFGDRSQPVSSGGRILILLTGLAAGFLGLHKMYVVAVLTQAADVSTSKAIGLGLYLVVGVGFLLPILSMALSRVGASKK